MIFIFLSSGLFLGWSLGANDAANIFGTAVSTKMVRFRVAAVLAGVFVILGAVIGGAGATHTLGKLGSVNALPGAFMVAFSAGFTVFMMTRYKLPVSTSQAIVGSIIGWNLYAQVLTDSDSLTKIVSTWILCPVLAAAIAMILYIIIRWTKTKIPTNLFSEDYHTRIGLLLLGAFGAYSLGANNIANVMGVFVNSLPIEPITFFGLFTLSGAQILFLIGGIAIAAGIITYSHKVMDTVGANLLRLSPLTAFIVVLAESIVLFVFSSERLEYFLVSHGLPALPLVPVSSSQAVVGAVIGIGLIKSYRQIRIKVLAEIATGWVTTPIIAGLITFVFLFFLQNVFNQKVYYASEYLVSGEVISHLQKQNMDGAGLEKFRDKSFDNEIEIFQELNSIGVFSEKQITEIIRDAKIEPTLFDAEIIKSGLDTLWLSAKQVQAVHGLAGSQFTYRWQVEESLQAKEAEWSYKPAGIFNRQWNRNLQSQYDTIFRTFKTRP